MKSETKCSITHIRVNEFWLKFFLISNNFIHEKRSQKGTWEVYMIQNKELSTKRANIKHIRHCVKISYVEGR